MGKKPIAGKHTYIDESIVDKATLEGKIVGLAGNPNVGKSTVFIVSAIWNS